MRSIIVRVERPVSLKAGVRLSEGLGPKPEQMLGESMDATSVCIVGCSQLRPV
jgi:hypothetical protein